MSELTYSERENYKVSLENAKQKGQSLQKYYSNLYKLENQALRNGFGKMVRAINQTNPNYSFGHEKRFFTILKSDNLPYEHRALEDEKYGNVNIGYHNLVNSKSKNNFTKTIPRNESCTTTNKKNCSSHLRRLNFVSGANNATDYLYVPPPTYLYKHSKSPKWTFGTAKRDFYGNKHKYNHYNLPYDKTIDSEKINKKWKTRIIGGDIGLDERFQDNKYYPEKTLLPGPGRYNPKDIYFKYTQSPFGYMGMKLYHGPNTKDRVLRNGLIPFTSNVELDRPDGYKSNFRLNKPINFQSKDKKYKGNCSYTNLINLSRNDGIDKQKKLKFNFTFGKENFK